MAVSPYPPLASQFLANCYIHLRTPDLETLGLQTSVSLGTVLPSFSEKRLCEQ